MTDNEKLVMTRALLALDSYDEDDRLSVYLDAAKREILAWRYSYAKTMPDEVPPAYEMTQIHAVVAGYSISGAENQTTHTENGVSRTFRYADMLAYIRAHVIPICKVM